MVTIFKAEGTSSIEKMLNESMDDRIKEEDAQRYLASMNELSLRIDIVQSILKGFKTTGHSGADIEFIALQIRKILELIALASICVNLKSYAKARKSFSKDWKAKEILKIIERENPYFYPEPGIQKIDLKTRKVVEIVMLEEGSYLSRSEFESLYDKCCEYLHAKNPYDENKLEYTNIKDYFTNKFERIKKLLNHHHIQLQNPNCKLWVTLNADGPLKARAVEMIRGN